MKVSSNIKKSQVRKGKPIPVGSDFSIVEDSAEESRIMSKILKNAAENAEAEAVANGLPRIVTRSRSLVLVMPDGKEEVIYKVAKGEKPFFSRSGKKGMVLHAVKSK